MVKEDARYLLYLKPPTADDLLSELAGQNGWNVCVATRPDAAIALLGERTFRVGLVQCDDQSFDPDAMRRQAEFLLDADSNINWIALLGGHAESIRHVSKVITTYFYDYHTLPIDTDRLLITLGRAYGMAQIANVYRDYRHDESVQCGMVGRDSCMVAMFNQIKKVAAIDLNVLIRGESGTGKELTASAIHRLSRRSASPFVAVNCGALPKDLIQAELFGYEKGSFTGADRLRVGRIEAAQSGTLFLDEIGDLPLDLQVNLLRFLQEKTIDRIGSSRQIPVDVRVIAATHVNLERAVEEGRFREDLYYRLNVLHVQVPPLRQRGNDLELLAHYLFEQFAKRIRPDLKGFSQTAIDAINAYPWPGNVREMVNRVQRAVVMCEGRLIRPRDLGLDRDAPNLSLMTLAEARARAEKDVIENTLSAMRNNVSKTAKRLDISRVSLYRLMELHSIDWQRDKDV